MYQGKYSKSRRKHSAAKRPVAVLVSLALILLLGVGATIAFLQDETTSVENTFTPAEVPPEVTESFNGTVKENVQVKNSGNVSAYIRAAIVVTWQDDDGNIAPEVPVLDTDYSMALATANWVKVGNYYYYTQPVAAGSPTTNLINQAFQLTEKTGYNLHIEIMAQTIQADGTDSQGNKPVELAWGVDPETLAQGG